MSDNIIKMFIGGEEVVSNKEFTINEEMLSASSTILNNCYPASWEQNKDYVNNFYYPKDYSKFILGKGNFTYGTDQYYVLTVSGETFMQFTTNVEKEWNSFNVYGKTTQATRSGINKLKMLEMASTTTNGLTYRVSDEVFYINGTSTANSNLANIDFEDFTLPAGTYYFYLLRKGTSRIDISMRGVNGVVVSATNFGNVFQNTLTNRQFTLTEETTFTRFTFYVPNGTTFNNDEFRIMVCNDSHTATEYEKYGAMPSPDYPSPLVSVGYENLFDKNTSIVTGKTWTSTGTETNLTNAFIQESYISVSPNTAYTISTTNNYSSTTDFRLQILEYDTNKNFIKRNIGTAGGGITTKYTIITGATTCYVRLGASTVTIDELQFEKGSIAHSYIPYGKYGIEVKTTGKNLCDITNPTANYYSNGLPANTSNTIIIDSYDSNNISFHSSSANYNMVLSNILQLEPNTTYTIKFNKETTATNNQFFIYNYINGVYSINYRDNNTNVLEKTFTTNSAGQIAIAFGYGNVIGTTTISNIQIEKGNQATEYESFQSNTQLYQLDNPLRAIGNYKDKLYIENGILYVERKIAIKILNGSENWNRGSSATTRSVYLLDTFTDKLSGQSNFLSNNFYYKGNAQSSDLGYAMSFNTGIYSNYIYIQVPLDVVAYNQVADFKNWLSTHNTEVQYILNESYTEELGQVLLPNAYNGINNIFFYTGLETTEDVYYYWKNYDVLFAGIVKNSGDISLRPTDPKYCSLQILDYKTFLSESDTLDFVISDKTIAEAITMVVDAISGYGFILGTINISQADDIIGAYSTLNKTAYDVFQYLANISGSRWRARFVDSDTMAIDFYDPELLPRANDIDYTQQYWEDNNIVDLTFNYGTRDYRNKQIILSDEVYGGIDYTEVLLSNGYGTSYITQNNIANITSITVNGVEAEVITQSEKDLGVDADFYYTPGNNVVESTNSYTAGTQIIITYTPLVKGRQIVYNDEEVTRIATQTNTLGIISRYESRNDILSSDELENIAETYIKYKGKPEIILKLITQDLDLFNIGEITYFNAPIDELKQDYMVKSKETEYIVINDDIHLFYTYELTSSFNSEKAINYFDNQRNKATGNIAEGESITRNIDINNSAMIIWENATITEISVSVDGDNALNSVLNSPFIQ